MIVRVQGTAWWEKPYFARPVVNEKQKKADQAYQMQMDERIGLEQWS